MRVLVSGSSGLIGTSLVHALEDRGHEVLRLVRSRNRVGPAAVFWDPSAGVIDAAGLEDLDAAIHLSGESIGAVRWTAPKKANIYESRVGTTRVLVDALSGLSRPPKTLLCASAVGYYGDRGDEILREDSGPGVGFLASLAQDWEAQAMRAAEVGMREARLRFGPVLTAGGRTLTTMARPFRWGLGARIGSGRHYFSWITLDDALVAILFILESPALQGPINVSTPNPVTNREMTRALGQALHRPAALVVPAAVFRITMREWADEVLLASVRAQPAKLLTAGFTFRHPDLGPALREMLA